MSFYVLSFTIIVARIIELVYLADQYTEIYTRVPGIPPLTSRLCRMPIFRSDNIAVFAKILLGFVQLA